MCAYTSKIEESEKAFEYLRYIHQSEKDVNNKKVAEVFDVNQSRASTLLGELEDKKLLTSRKEGRKKIYEYSPEGMYELFWKLTKYEMRPGLSGTEELTVENIKKQYPSSEEFNEIDEDFESINELIDYISTSLKPEFFVFLNFYVRDYFFRVNKSTLKQMFIEDFYRGFSEIDDRSEYPKSFEILNVIHQEFGDIFENPRPIVMSALLDLNKLMEEEMKEKED